MKKKKSKKSANKKEQSASSASSAQSSIPYSTIKDSSNLSNLFFVSSSKDESAINIGKTTKHAAPEISPPPLFVGPIQLTNATTTSEVLHGRGLVASRDIQPGECLFVTSPTLEANVSDVKSEWIRQLTEAQQKQKEQQQKDTLATVDQVAEDVLLRKMMETLKQSEICPRSAAVANSFLDLVGGSDKNGHRKEEETTSQSKDDEKNLSSLMDRLNGSDSNLLAISKISAYTFENMRSILHHNAFGPDFLTGEYIQRRWMTETSTTTKHSNENSTNKDPTYHVLGIYPLAAMINHSCLPNAVRVLCSYNYRPTTAVGTTTSTTLMVVHATAPIKAGQEIVWSYIPPTQPYHIRRQMLQTQHGFLCYCERCKSEASFFEAEAQINESNESSSSSLLTARKYLVALDPWNKSSLDESKWMDLEQRIVLMNAIQELETNVMTSTDFSSSLKRYLRIGTLHATIHYLNVALEVYAHSEEKMNDLLQLASQLHFTFCACDNACTAHLSILHVCYDIIASLHTRAASSSSDQIIKTLPKLRFWTEQLKRAHMIRYGSLGNDVEAVRTVMQHTKLILRNKDAIDRTKYQFI